MNIALCTQDNTIYTANDFMRTEGFETKKRFLVCSECNGPAFFRSPTRNGREACFGALPHADGCTLSTQGREGTAAGQGNVEDEIIATGQRIVIDFNYGAPGNDFPTQPTEEGRGFGQGRTFTGEGTTVRENSYRRLGPLLTTLMVSEEFRRSNQTVMLPGQGEYAASSLFVSFGETTELHIDRFHGYWGMIPDAQIDGNGTLWFNSGGREDISVLLDQRFIETTLQRYHIESVEEIAGAYLLVFGELKRARSTGKKFVQITDPSRFVLRLA